MKIRIKIKTKYSYLLIILLSFSNIENIYADEINSLNISDKSKSYSSKIEEKESNTSQQSHENIYSYGNWKKSIMFSNENMMKMKRILKAYEKANGLNDPYLLSLIKKADVKKIKKQKLVNSNSQQITSFPNFHLKSIVFRSKNDWSIWVNNIKITNKNNNRDKYELKVTSINQNEVSFSWKAKDVEYMKLFLAYHEHLNKNKSELNNNLKNRFIASKRRGYINPEKLSLYFSLRQNQSISGETLRIFEGKPSTILVSNLNKPFVGLTVKEKLVSDKVPPFPINDLVEDTRQIRREPEISNNPFIDRSVSSNLVTKISPKSRMLQSLGLE